MLKTHKRIVLSGCSGGGKSTLLEALALKGFATKPEAGRQVVKTELRRGGGALPWADMHLFMRKLIDVNVTQFDTTRELEGPIFYDRSLIDAANWYLSTSRPQPPHLTRSMATRRYATDVFLVPPWPRLFARDQERRHAFKAALREYASLRQSYAAFGYRCHILPHHSIEHRIEIILKTLQA